MTLLALDIGEVRTGVAVSDPAERVASPLKVISTVELTQGSREFRRIVSDYSDICLLVGLPLSLDGQEHQQAAWVREQAETIAHQYGLPLVFHDERRSSAQAESVLREMGYNAQSMRGKVDMIAASIFLQSYLDGLGRDNNDRKG
jgi:putative Holliday junction resolvase